MIVIMSEEYVRDLYAHMTEEHEQTQRGYLEQALAKGEELRAFGIEPVYTVDSETYAFSVCMKKPIEKPS